MILILITALIVAGVMGLQFLTHGDPGNVTIDVADKIISFPLWSSLIALALAFIVLYFVFRILGSIFRVPGKVGLWKTKKTEKKVGKTTQKGYIDLIEGKYDSAEKKLLTQAEKSATPVLNYLAAAHAAHLKGNKDKRDTYLGLAYASDPSSKVAVEMTHAQMMRESGDLTLSRKKLQTLQYLSPKNEQIQRMLLEVNRELEDWGGVLQQLPRLKKLPDVTEEELAQYENEACIGILDCCDSIDDLDQAWKQLSGKQKKQSEMKSAFVHRLLDEKKDYRCEEFIRKNLSKMWDSELAYLYGLVDHDAARQLRISKGWYKNNQEDPNLLLTIGRLAIRTGETSVAIEFLEKAIEAGAGEEANRELGRLYEQEGETQKALEYYRSGLDRMLPFHDNGEEESADDSEKEDVTSEVSADNNEEDKASSDSTSDKK